MLGEAGIAHLVHAPRSATRTAVVVEGADRAAVARLLSRRGDLRLAKVADGPVGPLIDPDSPSAAALLREAQVLGVVGPAEFVPDHVVERLKYAVEIEFWSRDSAGHLRPHRVAGAQSILDDLVPDRSVGLSSLGRFHDPTDPDQARDLFPTRSELLTPPITACDLPIDAVYTWVDGRDPAWVARRDAHHDPAGTRHPEAASAARYLSRDELRYSIRSILAYAPWVRRIHVLTDSQRPAWLPQDTDRVRVVDHREVFAHPQVLPVFNSHAIESQLHRVPDLVNHFLYFNDDVLLGSPVQPEDFVSAVGHSAIHLSKLGVPVTRFPDLENPIWAAYRNVRRLIEQDFGRVPTSVTWHVPHSLRVDVLEEMAQRYAEPWRRTEASRFRDDGDLSPTSNFYQYFAWFTGRAFLGQLTYSYLNLAAAGVRQRLDRLAAMRAHQVLCLNDSDAQAEEESALDAAVGGFLRAYLPLPGPHESPA